MLSKSRVLSFDLFPPSRSCSHLSLETELYRIFGQNHKCVGSKYFFEFSTCDKHGLGCATRLWKGPSPCSSITKLHHFSLTQPSLYSLASFAVEAHLPNPLKPILPHPITQTLLVQASLVHMFEPMFTVLQPHFLTVAGSSLCYAICHWFSPQAPISFLVLPFYSCLKLTSLLFPIFVGVLILCCQKLFDLVKFLFKFN